MQELKHGTQIKLFPRLNGFNTTISYLITDKITDIPNVPIKASSIKIPEGITLADLNFDETRDIDILIAAGLFWDLFCIGHVKLSSELPMLQKTKLGWLLTGALHRDVHKSYLPPRYK